jgi:type IV fimbrial biogenesis protein FimT
VKVLTSCCFNRFATFKKCHMKLISLSRNKCQNPANQIGFTLVELMVTIAIVGILAAIAMPNFQSMIQANRIQSAAAEFQAGLALARAEAIKRGGDARVAIVPNAVGGTTAWPNGFTVFFDRAGTANSDVAPLVDSSGITILMVTSAASSSMTVAPNATTPHIIFNGRGRTINQFGAELGASFAFTPSSGHAEATTRCVIVSLIGRTRTTRLTPAEFTAKGNECDAIS